MKRLSPEVASEPRHVERERAEALLTGRLVHPNILPVLDYCLLDGQAVTVLDDVHAVDLLHLLERATTERRRLAPRLALGIAWSVLNALVHAHNRADPSMGIAGIAHGDLSPSNILIEHTGRVLLRDFGIPLQASPPDAAGNPTEPLARLGRLHGKAGYMSPELVTRGVITPRSDVFAVGILLYELITFRRLFGAKDGAETLKAVALAQVDDRILRYAGELPMPLRELMRRALKRQPDERFATAYDMLRALEAFFPGNPHEVGPELAHFVAELALDTVEEDSVVEATPSARRRTGRRTPSRMILPAAGEPESEFEADFDATQHWANNTLPGVDVATLLADIEPVGPPPLPSDAIPSSTLLAPLAPLPLLDTIAAPPRPVEPLVLETELVEPPPIEVIAQLAHEPPPAPAAEETKEAGASPQLPPPLPPPLPK